MQRSVLLAVTATLSVTIGSCGSDSTVSVPTAPQIAIISGNNQSGIVGQELPAPLVVSVTQDGEPVRNFEVAWSTSTDDASLSTAASRTDSRGQTSVSLTLGDTDGQVVVKAALAPSSVSFNETARAQSVPPSRDRVLAVHFDGNTWTTSLIDAHRAGAEALAVWGASSSDVFMGGGACGGYFVLRYNASAWQDTPPDCGGTFTNSSIRGLWGNSASDAFFVTRGFSASSEVETRIKHYDSNGWTLVLGWSCRCAGLYAIWTKSATEAFAVGDSGLVMHLIDGTWTKEVAPTAHALLGVWGDKNNTTTFAVGEAGTIVFYNGSAWTAQTSSTTANLYGVWGSNLNDVYAVGDGGTIIHYNGAVWSPQSSGTTQGLRGISGTSSSSVIAVGNANTVTRFDGTKWTAQRLASLVNLRGVWQASPTDIFAVGTPRTQ